MDDKEMVKGLIKYICDTGKISGEELLNILFEDAVDEDKPNEVGKVSELPMHRVRFNRLGKYRNGVGAFRICESLWLIDEYKEYCYVADRELARECENAYRAFINK